MHLSDFACVTQTRARTWSGCGRHVCEGPKIRSTDSTGPKDVYSRRSRILLLDSTRIATPGFLCEKRQSGVQCVLDQLFCL